MTRWGAACAVLLCSLAPAPVMAQTVPGPAGSPWEMPLFAAPAASNASGFARLVYAPSPFGVAVTADGRARYDVQVTTKHLPRPETLGPYHAFVIWAVTPDLSEWKRLGALGPDTTTVGRIDWNKFLLVIQAAPDSASTSHAGPTVLHGTSPSGWLQTFLSHPMFRGMAWGG
jgi:hypothetical protein